MQLGRQALRAVARGAAQAQQVVVAARQRHRIHGGAEHQQPRAFDGRQQGQRHVAGIRADHRGHAGLHQRLQGRVGPLRPFAIVAYDQLQQPAGAAAGRVALFDAQDRAVAAVLAEGGRPARQAAEPADPHRPPGAAAGHAEQRRQDARAQAAQRRTAHGRGSGQAGHHHSEFSSTRSRACGSSGTCGASAGRRTVQQVPSPSRLSRLKVPPSSVATAL